MARGVYLDPGFPWLISIGDRVTLSPSVMVLVHDAAPNLWTGYSLIAPVTIGDRVYVGAHSILLPGVTIGDDAVVGAGSVVRSDVPAGALVLGNPAEVVSSTERFLDRHRRRMRERPRYPATGFSVLGGVTESNRRRMLEELADGPGYVE
jgi:maltose O-acetyltransferase